MSLPTEPSLTRSGDIQMLPFDNLEEFSLFIPLIPIYVSWASQMVLMEKNLPANARNTGDAGSRFSTWVGNIPWRRAWQPTPVFLLGESHGQRSLAGYSPWGRKELDTTEVS